MTTASFDPNKWYLLTVASSSTSALQSTDLYDGTRGAVYMNELPDPIDDNHLWQIIPSPLSQDQWLLRTRLIGAAGYFGVGTPSGENETDATRWSDPTMIKFDHIKDNECFWHIEPWGDGTYYFYNMLNGTSLHLSETSSGNAEMSSDIVEADSQRWTFVDTGTSINNILYSTLPFKSTTYTIGTTATTTSSTSHTSTQASATSSSILSGSAPASASVSATATPTSTRPASTGSSSKSGISTNATIAIALSLGCAIAIVLGLFFWLLRRRRRPAPPPEHHFYVNHEIPELPAVPHPVHVVPPPEKPRAMPTELVAIYAQDRNVQHEPFNFI